MAENIDSLSIQLSANASRAASNIDSLANRLSRLGGSSRNASSGMEVLNDQMEHAAPRTVDVGNSIRSLGSRLQSALTPLRTFATTVGGRLVSGLGNAVAGIGYFVGGIARIAKYRAIRAFLKDMGQSFKDLYGYSKLFGTDFAKSMDTINTSLVYFRNSVAAMVAPLINALAPVLDFIIDKIVDVLNWFNRLFAALSGASTYTVAKKIKVSWEDSFDNTSKKAKKTANDIKRTILGFDEINKLTAPKDTSSSGSTGKSPYSKNYDKMFETKPLTGAWSGLSDALEKSIKNKLDRIKLIVSGATLAVGAILAFSGANIPLGIGLMAVGAAGIAATVAMNWDSLDSNIKRKITTIAGIISVASVVVGAILAFTGVAAPAGIALMAAGFGGMAATIDWNFLVGKVKQGWEDIKLAASVAWDSLKFLAKDLATYLRETITGAWESIKLWTINKWESIKETISAYWGLLKEGVVFWGETIRDGVVGAWESIKLWTVNKWETIKGAVTGFWEDLKTGVAEFGMTIRDGVVGAWESIKSWTTQKWEAITGAVVEFWNDLKSGVVEFGTTIRDGIVGAWESVKSWTEQKWTAITGAVTGAWDSLKKNATTKFNSVKSTISKKWSEMSAAASERWKSILDSVTAIWENIKENATTKFGTVKSEISKKWDEISNTASEKWTSIKGTVIGIWGDIKTNSTNTFASVSENVSGAFSAAKTTLNEFGSWLTNNFGKTWTQAWTTIVNKLGPVFDAIKAKLKSPINSVIDLLNKMLDKVQSAVNKVVRGINSKLTVHDPFTGRVLWKPNISTVSWGHINRLASGGILQMPTMLTPNVMAGEAGKEAVLPLDNHTEWMDALSDRILDAASARQQTVGCGDNAEELSIMRQMMGDMRSMLAEMRRFNEKDFSTEITTAQVNRAMQRTNRRAGTTVVAVG